MSEIVRVGRLSDIPPLGGRCVETAKGPVGVFRTADDRIFAIHNRCPHRGGPLSEGIVHGTHVTCPLHNMVISLASGCVEGPDDGAVETIPVDVADGAIHLTLPKKPLGRQPTAASATGSELAATANEVADAGEMPQTLPNTATRRVAPSETA